MARSLPENSAIRNGKRRRSDDSVATSQAEKAKSKKQAKRSKRKSRSWESENESSESSAHETEMKPEPQFVVAIDFGTTFSGAAFARTADLLTNPRDAMQLFTNWPCQGEAGAGTYCKTQTSVWYMPGPTSRTFELKGWGWKAFVGYKRSLQEVANSRNHSHGGRNSGHFLTRFKLGLDNKHLGLPRGLTLNRVISDYLREIFQLILNQIRLQNGSEIKAREIQFVFTVPAMWDDHARHAMQQCAEMAGLVGGPFCTDRDPSVHDLIMVAEPEAAGVYVHNNLKPRPFSNGDKFMVVDIGGGTTDIVMHEKVGSTTRANIKIKEISVSIGGRVGGCDVDNEFFKYLRRTVGQTCFAHFEEEHPLQLFELNRWWGDVKVSFDGESDYQLPLPATLAKLWKKFDRANHLLERRRTYESLRVDSVTVKKIFEPVVAKIFKLMDQQIIPNLAAILVVGGFSDSPYLRKRIEQRFRAVTPEIMFPRNAGSAVVQGALTFGLAKEMSEMIASRISTRTYGFDTSTPFVRGVHREDYLVRDHRTKKEMCDNIFRRVIQRGDEISVNCSRTINFSPLYRTGTGDGEDIELNLYSTKAKNPLYVTEKGVTKLATCTITVPRKDRKGREPEIEVFVRFGTQIRTFVKGKNFSGQPVAMRAVKMNWIPRTAGELTVYKSKGSGESCTDFESQRF